MGGGDTIQRLQSRYLYNFVCVCECFDSLLNAHNFLSMIKQKAISFVNFNLKSLVIGSDPIPNCIALVRIMHTNKQTENPSNTRILRALCTCTQCPCLCCSCLSCCFFFLSFVFHFIGLNSLCLWNHLLVSDGRRHIHRTILLGYCVLRCSGVVVAQ